MKKLGGPFASAWQTRYAKLYPNRLELHPDSGNNKPEVRFFEINCRVVLTSARVEQMFR